uniref:Uncharacterized protein n=1 Tax=Solanum tuberosum TaxID=4113 RepID=M1C9K0_SOLTU
MKLFYTALLDFYSEVEKELAKENKSFRVNFAISEEHSKELELERRKKEQRCARKRLRQKPPVAGALVSAARHWWNVREDCVAR